MCSHIDGYNDTSSYKPPTKQSIQRQVTAEKQSLLNDIEIQITKVKKDGGFNNQQWKDETSRYPQKFNVLTALKTYLNGGSIDDLRAAVRDNPKYDKGMGKTETEKVLERVLEFKGETLTPRRRHGM